MNHKMQKTLKVHVFVKDMPPGPLALPSFMLIVYFANVTSTHNACIQYSHVLLILLFSVSILTSYQWMLYFQVYSWVSYFVVYIYSTFYQAQYGIFHYPWLEIHYVDLIWTGRLKWVALFCCSGPSPCVITYPIKTHTWH